MISFAQADAMLEDLLDFLESQPFEVIEGFGTGKLGLRRSAKGWLLEETTAEAEKLTTDQAAAYLGVSKAYLYSLVSAGKISSERIGRQSLYATSVLDAYRGTHSRRRRA